MTLKRNSCSHTGAVPPSVAVLLLIFWLPIVSMQYGSCMGVQGLHALPISSPSTVFFTHPTHLLAEHVRVLELLGILEVHNPERARDEDGWPLQKILA
jgi:hypothetical protein